MKKIIIPAISLAALLLTGACSIDERTSGGNGNEAMLTLNMGLDGAVQTRAIGDGSGANHLIYAVFDENGTPIEGIEQVSKDVTFPTTETITLAKGQTYRIAFWAQNKACTAYTVSDGIVTINYEKASGNDETRDAFFKTVKVTVTGDAELDVELTRPFAQINVGVTTEDWNAAVAADITITESNAVVKQAASTLNLLDGTVADPTDVIFDFANIPPSTEALSVDLDGEGPEDYKYLSMNYILPYDATTGDASTTLEDLEFTFSPKTGNDITLTKGLDAVPVQRNWRTNIVGRILSGDLSLNISIDPGFNGDNNHEICWDGSAEEPETDPDDPNTYRITTPAELAWVAEQVNSKKEYFEGKTILLMNDIDLSGSYWTPVGNVTAYPTVTFKGTFDGQEHTISNLTASDDAAGYAAAGLFGSILGTVKNVILKDVNIRSTHYAGAVVGYSSMNGAIIENCHVDGGTITSVPEFNGTSYDNGDNAGGIIGYYVTYDKITDCSAKNLTITAYRELGGITGCGPQSGMTGCLVENITLVQDNTNGYKTEAITTVGALGGRDVNNGNQPYDGEYASAVTKKIVVTSNEQLAAAAIADNATIYLRKGEYVIPAAAQGKTVTFIGTGNPKDVIVKVVPPTGSYENCDYGLDGSNATFEGITITTNSTTYIGYARCNGTYKNCIINGTYTLYGESTFENCEFNVSDDVYNIWTWGAKEIEFTGCTFNSDGKALLLYREDEGTVNLTVTNCTFIDKGGLENAMKAAIEIGDSPYKKPTYNVTVSETTVIGYAINDEGISTGTALWGNKNSIPEDRLNVTIDGTVVY